MAQDYYSLLGISKGATDDEIKKAYRRKAMELHPDKHKGDKAVEEKFKEINKAYEVLSDKQKRGAYDQFGEAGVNYSAGQGGMGGNGFGFDFSGFKTEFNGDSFSDIFEAFFTGFGTRSNAPRKGRNLDFELRISFQEAIFGCEKELVVTRPEGKNGKSEENIKIKIPAGVDTGSVIRMGGKGEPGINGGPTGDLFVHIVSGKSVDFDRQGYDLYSIKEISVLQAILGDQVQVKTTTGELTLKIPAGTQPGKIFKIKNEGVNQVNSTEKGDLYVKVKINIPTKLSKKEKKYYQELAAEESQKGASKGGFWG